VKTGKFVCLTGIDGAGKTTLARLVVGDMNNNGTKAMYVYNRYIPFLAKPAIWLAGVLLLRNKDIYRSYHEYSSSKRAASSNHPFLAEAYQYLLIFDYLIQIFAKISIPIALGKTVICDRYIYDTLATDLAIDFNYTDDKLKCALKRFLHISPAPYMIFLIDLPEEVAMSRKTDVPSIDYLKERRRFYLILADILPDVIILNGCQSPEDLKVAVLEGIGRMRS
jgi:thymidylate kinase